MRRLQARMGRLRGGRGLDGAVDMGARGAAARDLAQLYVREAQSQGAQVSLGTDSGVLGEEGPQDLTPGSGEGWVWGPGLRGVSKEGLRAGLLGLREEGSGVQTPGSLGRRGLE